MFNPFQKSWMINLDSIMKLAWPKSKKVTECSRKSRRSQLQLIQHFVVILWDVIDENS